MMQHSHEIPAARVASSSAPPATTRFLRLKQIIGPHGPLPISRSGFWKGVKDGKFPRPRKISPRVTVWRAEDIDALVAKIAEGTL